MRFFVEFPNFDTLSMIVEIIFGEKFSKDEFLLGVPEMCGIKRKADNRFPYDQLITCCSLRLLTYLFKRNESRNPNQVRNDTDEYKVLNIARNNTQGWKGHDLSQIAVIGKQTPMELV